jgi:hypothetical protein
MDSVGSLMNKIICNFASAIAVALLACACLCGCAGKPEAPHPPQPVTIITTGDILDAMNFQATRLTNLRAGIRLKLTIHEQTRPEIKGQLMWTRTREGVLARVIGHGPFGITVFDCLVAERSLYLFIPSHKAVYVSSINYKIKNVKKISALINEASWLLNPWSVVRAQDVQLFQYMPQRGLENDKNVFYIIFFHKGGSGWAKFDRQTLSPISIENSEFQALYDDHVYLEDHAPYPGKIRMKFKKMHLEIKIDLKDIQIDSLTPEDRVFSPALYLNQPLRPLTPLLDSLH